MSFEPATDSAPDSAPDSSPRLMVAVLGGTGPQGRGLGRRFALAGHEVILGSRDGARAEGVAAELASALPGTTLSGASNAAAAAAASIVIVAVPYEGHRALLESLRAELAGKIVVDCVNPLAFDDRGPHPLAVAAGSAAQEAQVVLPDSRVVAAFHHVSAVLLEDPLLATVETDVLVLGDDRSATDAVEALVATVTGMRGIYAGRLRNAAQIEALTANLIAINRRYRTHAGIRITGL